MEWRTVPVSVAIASVAVLGLASAAVIRQCEVDQRCIPFVDCIRYRNYSTNQWKEWPPEVQDDVRSRLCETERLATGSILYKICCDQQGRDLLNFTTCGQQTKVRIANGQRAEVFEYPWMALLRGYDGTFHCGGSLIARRYVLTAAHCRRKTVVSVRLGETDLSTPIDCLVYNDGEKDCADPHQDIAVEKFIRHPDYSTAQKKHDIALLRLASAAQLNDNVGAICLPRPEVANRRMPSKMIISGWGYTEDGETEASNQLRYASVPLVDLRQCNESLVRVDSPWTVDESQLCAGAGSDGADSCQGDSGGPLQYPENGRYVIYGVVSYGQAICGATREPAVYARVLHYFEWIIDNLE